MTTASNNGSKNVLNSDVEVKGTINFAGELTFDGKVEGRPTPEIPPDRVYQAGKPFGTPKARAA